MSSSPQQILKQHWGHDNFRPLQEDIISSVLDGNDVLALLPTGGGKSICFQVPALAKEGLCLVVSPLIALMKDQVENLKKRNILALSIQSGMSYFEVRQALHNAAFGPYKFLYVSPERLETDLFKEFIPAFNLNLIAVDEAHCISQWGYDFRPPYLRIANLREHFPKVPVLALTASATPLVQEDICVKLQFKNHKIFRQSFEKPNLSFSVFKVDSKINKLLEIIEKVPGSAIVYCRNRKKTKEYAHLLQLNHISADYYHAGLTQEERNKKQENWIHNNTRLIVCTNAFGMGIDKPDVRVVIHVDIPDNLENYYQEAGRAGRDGKRSYAVLLYNQEELDDLKTLPDIKYPPVQDIKEIYQAIANHLQIAVGAGKGMYFDFNLNDFIKFFKLDVFLTINAIKALEQQDYLSFNEQVFLAAKAGFTCTKEELEAIEKSHPDLDIVVKTLLRAYEGIYDNVVSINENLIARIIKIHVDEVKRKLQVLQGLGMLTYQPQKETPQLFFAENRASSEYLIFDSDAYHKRKKLYKERVEAMEKYVTQTTNCRSQYIGKYFGDTDMKPCGVCDNCIAKKDTHLSHKDFDSIAKTIMTALKDKPLELKQIKVPGFKKENVWKVLEYLQSEGKLSINNFGHITLPNHTA